MYVVIFVFNCSFGFPVSLLPEAQGAGKCPAAGLEADPAAAGRATLAGAAIARAADVQPPTILGVIDERETIAHKGKRRLDEIRDLRGKRRKGWLIGWPNWLNRRFGARIRWQ